MPLGRSTDSPYTCSRSSKLRCRLSGGAAFCDDGASGKPLYSRANEIGAVWCEVELNAALLSTFSTCGVGSESTEGCCVQQTWVHAIRHKLTRLADHRNEGRGPNTGWHVIRQLRGRSERLDVVRVGQVVLPEFYANSAITQPFFASNKFASKKCVADWLRGGYGKAITPRSYPQYFVQPSPVAKAAGRVVSGCAPGTGRLRDSLCRVRCVRHEATHRSLSRYQGP